MSYHIQINVPSILDQFSCYRAGVEVGEIMGVCGMSAIGGRMYLPKVLLRNGREGVIANYQDYLVVCSLIRQEPDPQNIWFNENSPYHAPWIAFGGTCNPPDTALPPATKEG